MEIVENGVAATALGLLWLVAITNAFNLLDNMDGLAGSLAVVAAILAMRVYTLLHRPITRVMIDQVPADLRA